MNLKNIRKVFTSKFVRTGPSSYKKNSPGRRLTKVEKLLLKGQRQKRKKQKRSIGYNNISCHILY